VGLGSMAIIGEPCDRYSGEKGVAMAWAREGTTPPR
jgi:hypothetical protein